MNMTFSITTLGTKTLIITACFTITFNKLTLSINDSQYNDTEPNGAQYNDTQPNETRCLMLLSRVSCFINCYSECCYD